MQSADDLIAICEAHYSKDGEPFSIKGRRWVRDELFVPATEWRLWPVDHRKLCGSCREKAGMFAPWSPRLIRSLRKHRRKSKGCHGLSLLPIVVLILNLQRGAGKTFNVMALLFALMLTERKLRCAFLASAKDQAEALLRENIMEAIADAEGISDFEHVGSLITCEDTGSMLECVATSRRSITGRRRRVIVAEEARDLDAATFAAVVPSIRAQTKFECPLGHSSKNYDEHAHLDIPKCKCGRLMFPVVPKIILPSTSGMDDGSDDDWFNDLCDQLEVDPVPWTHMYRDDAAPNPAASKMTYDAIVETFGRVPGLAQAIDVEMHNVRKSKGDYLDQEAKKSIEDKSLDFVSGTLAPCFAFLDTSHTGDLTSLVIVGDHRERQGNVWQFVRLYYAQWWDPKKSPRGRIDEHMIQPVLDQTVPLFPNLEWLGMDLRSGKGVVWAMTVFQTCRYERPWGHIVEGVRPKYGPQATRDRQDAYDVFESRARSGTYRQPECPRIMKELNGLRKKQLDKDGSWVVTDISRKKMHAELVDGITECCRRIYLEMTRPANQMSELNSHLTPHAALKKVFTPVMAGLELGKGIY